MVLTIKQTEGVPASWPTTPTGLSTGAAALPVGPIWSRIEAWIARRYSSRSIQWVTEGVGEWVPPLSPATVSTVERWTGTAWEAVTLSASPLGGYDVTEDTWHRFTGTVGTGPAPEAVQEAFRRLAEYLGNTALNSAPSGATSYSMDMGGLNRRFDRDADWRAKAIINSGAADLLRPYRSA